MSGHRRQTWLLLVIFAALAVPSAVRAQSVDSRFLDGLRDRQLFELAETYCRDRLANLPPTHPGRAELAVEYIRALALHAANSPTAERQRLFLRARQAAQEALRERNTPKAVLVRVQDALTPLAQGELCRQEHQAGALAAEQLEPTRQALREAAELLETLDKELTREIPLRRRTAPRHGELSADELFALQQNVQHQLARAFKNRALLFSAGSSDRVALLVQATETLQKTLTQLSPDDTLAPTTQVDLAESYRLMGRFNEAERLLTALNAEGVDAIARLRARAELIRVAIDQKSTAAIERLIGEGRVVDGQISAELDYAWFEGFLMLAQASAGAGGDDQASKKFQEQAAETARFLEENHGAYWGRRADQLLAVMLPRSGGRVNLELLQRTADSLYLKGELNQAIAAYGAAAEQARAAGDPAAAFNLGYKAALIEQKRQRHAEAASRFRALAKGLATHPQAAETHLAAIWHTAKLLKAEPEAANSRAADEYVAILEEHLALWPKSESAHQARLWLGRVHESRGAWSKAIDAYAGVARSSPHFAAAIAGLASAWRAELRSLEAAGSPVEPAADKAIKMFQQAILGPENRLPERWTDADRAAALAAAELLLTYKPSSHADAEGILRTALDGSQDAPPEWRLAAQSQLIVALAGQPGRQEEARRLVQSMGQASDEQLLSILAGLSQVTGRVSVESRVALAGIQLKAAELLDPRRNQLTADERLTLDRIQAEALAEAGNRQAALAAFARLAKENPSSGSIQEGYADLLLAGSDRQMLEAALNQWRIVASRTKPRTERWLRAKYSVALAQFKLGDRASAATLLRYLLETPPGLEQTEWHRPYQELLSRCLAP